MPQMRTWKKTVKALVSTVEKKPVPSGRESCQRLAQRAIVVPMAATQPSVRRGHAGGSEASMQHDGDAGEREDDLGKDAEMSGTGFTAGPPLRAGIGVAGGDAVIAVRHVSWMCDGFAAADERRFGWC